MIRKLNILLALISFSYFKSNAQINYIPAAARQYCVSVGGGVTVLLGDTKKLKFGPAARLNFDNNITPFTSFGLEAQYGGMEGGEKPDGKIFKLYSKNTFFAINLNARVSLGQFRKIAKSKFQRGINGLYIGTGIGVVSSQVKDMIRDDPRTGQPLNSTQLNATQMLVPVNIGINIELPKFIGLYNTMFNINYQHNFVFGDYLDGYNLAVGNKYKDAYGFLSVALRYNFGSFTKKASKKKKS